MNTLGSSPVAPLYDEVAPNNGEACKEGWMNSGAFDCIKTKGTSRNLLMNERTMLA